MHERHGESGTRVYKIWCAMRERCYRKTHDHYIYYGGRGITVCDEWRRAFPAFSAWAKASGYQAGKSIDRINPNGNYEPENCRWATDKQQARNRRQDTNGVRVQFDGIEMNLSEWSRKTKIGYTTLVKRYNKGLKGDALFKPVRVYRDPFILAVLETRNGKAKLTAAQVAEILASSETGASLAKMFNVSQSAISMIRSGKRRSV